MEQEQQDCLGEDHHRGGDEHRILDIGHHDKEQRRADHGGLEVAEGLRPTGPLDGGDLDQVGGDVAQGGDEQQEVQSDVEADAGEDEEAHGGMAVVEPLDIEAEQLIDDADGGVEHHLDDHHRAREADCHRQEEEDLVEGGKLARTVGEEGSAEADDDVGRDEEEGEAQGIGEARLEGGVGKEADVVVKADEVDALAGERAAEVVDHALAEHARGALILRFTIGALREQTGAVEGALILVQDVTEAVRLEQTRRDYVANVSHELRTPLASIRSLSDALADGLVYKREDELRYYAYIQRESIRLSRLIDDLLELSRLQSGAVALTKQRMDVNELLEDVAGRYENIAAEKGFGIGLILPGELPPSFGNPDRTEQVLVALLDNAIKHNEGGGDILIRAEAREGEMIVSVENGGAIGEADIEHIFERFYKADHAHAGEGTGLGLSISKEIMDPLGERIWAESGEGRVKLSFTLQQYDPSMKNDARPGEKC